MPKITINLPAAYLEALGKACENGVLTQEEFLLRTVESALAEWMPASMPADAKSKDEAIKMQDRLADLDTNCNCDCVEEIIRWRRTLGKQ